jgi:hypothetical protein
MKNMQKKPEILNALHNFFLSEKTKKKSETLIIKIAIASFIIHSLLIGLVDFKILPIPDTAGLLHNPIVAIYTPFSFILIYEVYLLIFYLPKSISKYIGKQYEIITLILIRRIFKDLSKIKFTPDWFEIKGNLQFTYDIVGVIFLFYLIFYFYKLNQKKEEKDKDEKVTLTPEVANFVETKKIIATLLVPVLLILATYSFVHWIYENFITVSEIVGSIRDINKIFFDDFFTVLILTDVLLLLISFFHTDQFSKVIRNSGFIISTILIKLSFGIEGLLSTVMAVVAVLIGVILFKIHNQYEKLE